MLDWYKTVLAKKGRWCMVVHGCAWLLMVVPRAWLCPKKSMVVPDRVRQAQGCR